MPPPVVSVASARPRAEDWCSRSFCKAHDQPDPDGHGGDRNAETAGRGFGSELLRIMFAQVRRDPVDCLLAVFQADACLRAIKFDGLDLFACEDRGFDFVGAVILFAGCRHRLPHGLGNERHLRQKDVFVLQIGDQLSQLLSSQVVRFMERNIAGCRGRPRHGGVCKCQIPIRGGAALEMRECPSGLPDGLRADAEPPKNRGEQYTCPGVVDGFLRSGPVQSRRTGIEQHLAVFVFVPIGLCGQCPGTIVAFDGKPLLSSGDFLGVHGFVKLDRRSEFATFRSDAFISAKEPPGMPYFDHNATTPLFPVAREAWINAVEDAWQNPSSPYRASARVHRLLEDARHRLASIVGGPAEHIVFSGGATEATNALFAWARRSLPGDTSIIVSPTEHPSVLEPAKLLFGNRVKMLNVDSGGAVDLADLEARFVESRVGMVWTMGANNETGVLNPLADISALCRRRGVMHAIDGSQWFGKLPAAELPETAILVGCAHKFGGPKGTSFIRLPVGAEGFAGARGGAQENDHRAGTEDFPGIAAMVAALEYCEHFGAEDRHVRAGWRDQFERAILSAIAGAVIVGAQSPRLWNVVSVTMPRHENTRWVARLDRLGFQVSTGSACASGSAHPSHVLGAMGLEGDAARRTIRISSGWETTAGEWRELAEAIVAVWGDFESEDAQSSGSSVINI